MSGLRERSRKMIDWARVDAETLRPVPCLPLLALFSAGALPVALWYMQVAPLWLAGVLFVLLPLLAAMVFRPSPRYLAAATCLGLGSVWLQVWAPWRTYERYLAAAAAHAEIEAIIVDDRVPVGDVLQWVPEVRNVRVRLRRIRTVTTTGWQDCRGTVLLCNPPVGIGYGSRIHADGRLLLPRAGDLPGTFDYRRYLRSQGIRHVFRTVTVRRAGHATPGPRLLLQRLRDGVLTRVTADVDGGSNRAMLAAMALGFRQAMPAAERDIYLRSGMIHLFAVSGLHVGILCGLVLALLNLVGVPFGIRHFVGPVLLLVYVLIAGAAPSAVRAWLMLTIWCVGRGLQRPVVSTNAVLAAAFLLLLWNPLVLFQSGFQFSFVIVLCLIWGWQRGLYLLRYLDEARFWVPAGCRRRGIGERLWRFLVRSAMSMACAWIGGIGLTLYYNGLFLPTAALTNMVVCVLAWFILVGATLKTLLSAVWLSWPAAWLGHGVAMLLAAVRLLAQVAAQHGGAMLTARPGVPALGVYYALAALLFRGAGGLRARFVVAALLTSFTACLAAGHRVMPRLPRTTVLVLPETLAPVIVVRPDWPGGAPVVINAGDRRFGSHLAAWLRYHGEGTAAAVVLIDNRAAYTGGYEALAAGCHVRETVLLARDRRGVTALRRAQWCAGGAWRLLRTLTATVTPGVTVRKKIAAHGAAFTVDVAFPYDRCRTQIQVDIRPGRDTHVVIVQTRRDGSGRRREQRFPYRGTTAVMALD